MTAREILEQVGKILDERQEAHGDKRKVFGDIAERWNRKQLDRGFLAGVSPVDVVIQMMDFKMARLNGNPNNAENWLDIIGYAVCGLELMGYGKEAD